MSLRASIVTLLLLSCAGSVLAATQTEIDQAVERGVVYLRSAQEADGGWSYSGYNEGSTALAGLALLESGVKPTDPAILRAARLIRTGGELVTQTYSLALIIFFLDRLDDRQDAPLIVRLGKRLRDGQSANGGWSYTCQAGQHAGNRELSLLGVVASYGSDNSNTQFAILGLWVARRHGLDVKQALERTDKYFRDTQSADGGWPYVTIYVQLDPAARGRGQPTGESTGAMTCAGLLGLLVQMGNQAVLKASNVKDLQVAAPTSAPAAAFDPLQDPAVQAGLKRLEQFLMPQGTAGRLGLGTEMYFLWSIERVAVAYGLKMIGPVDWYSEGAHRILASQQPDGSWTDMSASVGTSFAMLFLRRANVAADLTRMVGGESTLRSSRDVGDLRNSAEVTRDTGRPLPSVIPAPPSLAEVSPAKLKGMLASASANQQSAILAELRDRKGSDATLALADAIESLSEPFDAQARKFLVERLERMTPATLVRYLEYDHDEIRRAAAQAAEGKQDRSLIGPLVALLDARNTAVADAGQAALQTITGQQFGSFAGQSSVNRLIVTKKWKAWWDAQANSPAK